MVSEINLAPAFTFALLSWYDANRRELPWRDHPYPYAVLVSEFMLQQTTVTAVISYFDKWIKRYPNIEKLAEADLEEVLRQWEGLGYYSRARNLHAAAGEIVSEYGGKVPADPHDLKKLPGVGDYTAAAVASIAFGVRAPALDANNLRVWSRLLASADRKRITRVFSRVIPPDRPGDFNQALMDLGNSVCTPRNPYCTTCPLALRCRAFRTEKVSEYPEKKKRPDTTHIDAAIGIIVKDDKILVQKRPETGLMAGMWEFPGGKIGQAMGGGERVRGREGETSKRGDTGTRRRGVGNTGHGDAGTRGRGDKAGVGVSEYRGVGETSSETPEEAVVREVREETGLRIQVCEKLGVFNHAYTRFRVKLHVFLCKRKAGTVHNSTAKWVTLDELERLAMPSVNRRIIKKLEERLKAEYAD